MNLRILLITGSLLLLAVVFGAFRGRHGSAVNHTKTPIDFTLHDLNGKPVQLSHYRGKVVVVDVWATWCGYCVGEIPELIAAQRQADRANTPLQFLGIAMDDNVADVRIFAAQQHFNYPILYKDDAQMQPLGEVDGYPTKFIIDKHGMIVDKIAGAVPIDTITQRVAKYLQ
jgi:thiol-disulfide isomerase/thioredoxin